MGHMTNEQEMNDEQEMSGPDSRRLCSEGQLLLFLKTLELYGSVGANTLPNPAQTPTKPFSHLREQTSESVVD